MASTYSTRLRIELIGTGEQSGTWGITTNANLGTLIEEAISGVATVNHTDAADYTLTAINGATDEARQMVLEIGGPLTANRNVVCPTAQKIYFVKNGTTGGFSITIKTSGGTGITVPNGQTKGVYCDGTNVVDLFNDIPVGSTIGGAGIVTVSGTQTLTNKTLTTPVIATISNTGTLTLPTATTTLVGRDTTDTLTNKTIAAGSNTISGLLHGTHVDSPTTGVHGVTGTVVGTSDAQTLTNKTIVAGSNTISGLLHGTHVDSPSSGVHGVTGSVVGTTDAQTLTNKTLTTPTVNGSGVVANTGAGTNATYSETGIDKSSASAETFNVQNSGAGAMTLQQDGVAVVTQTRAVNTGTGLTGGGNLSADRTISPDIASQAEAEAGTSSSKLMTPQRTAQAIAAQTSFGSQLLHVRDEKTSGTDGGNATAAGWLKRTLDDVKTNEITGASVSVSSVITLPTGEYFIQAYSPMLDVGSHKARLRNNTTISTAVVGRTSRSGASNELCESMVAGRFTVAAATEDFELQYFCTIGKGVVGLGQATGSGEVEVYSEAFIWKVG